MSSASFAPLFTSVEKESATFDVVPEVLEAEVLVALDALAFDAEVAAQPVNARAARRVMEVALLIILLFFTVFLFVVHKHYVVPLRFSGKSLGVRRTLSESCWCLRPVRAMSGQDPVPSARVEPATLPAHPG